MIIIFNLPGLVFGAAALFLGSLIAAATGKLGPGLVAVGLVWLFFGRGKVDPATGSRRPSPSLFFIPLYYLSFLAFVLAIPASFLDLTGGTRPADPRRALLKADEKDLDRTKLVGDEDLASSLFAALDPGARDGKMHILARAGEGRVLVLVKIPILKEFDDSARKAMLATLDGALKSHGSSSGKTPYIGIKGRLMLGAIQTPTGVRVGSVVDDDPLLAFYGAPAPAAVPGEATRP